MRHLLKRTPWLALTGALTVAVAASGIGYAASALTSSAAPNALVTCINNSTGQIRVVSTASQCTKKERAVLLQTTTPTSFVVDCGAGDKINDVLATVADGLEPVTIDVTGTCVETVEIDRNAVTLNGVGTNPGIHAPSEPGANTLMLQGAHDIHLNGLTLTGGDLGLAVWGGSSVDGTNLTITGARQGVEVSGGSSVRMWDLVVQDSTETGVRLSDVGGTLTIFGGTVANSGDRGVDCEQGQVFLGGVEITGTGGNHAVVGEWTGCRIGVADANIHDNDADGLIAFGGSSIVVKGGTIADNHGHGGAIAQDGGFVGLYGVTVTGQDAEGVVGYSAGTIDVQQSHLDANGGVGLALFGGSVARLESSTTVNDNGGSGISLEDVSVLTINEASVEVAFNDGKGVTCAPSPAVAMVHLPPSYTGIHDNTGGDLSCPTA